jgi:hypothetical protein
MYVYRFRSIDVNSDAGRSTAESLQRELLAKIQAAEDAMRSEVPYDLEKVMDIQFAKDEINVSFQQFTFTLLPYLMVH